MVNMLLLGCLDNGNSSNSACSPSEKFDCLYLGTKEEEKSFVMLY